MNTNWQHGLTSLGNYTTVTKLFYLPQLNRDGKEGVNSQDKLPAEIYLPIKHNSLSKGHILFHSPDTWITKSKTGNNGYGKLFLYFFNPFRKKHGKRALFLAKCPGTIAVVTKFLSAYC